MFRYILLIFMCSVQVFAFSAADAKKISDNVRAEKVKKENKVCAKRVFSKVKKAANNGSTWSKFCCDYVESAEIVEKELKEKGFKVDREYNCALVQW